MPAVAAILRWRLSHGAILPLSPLEAVFPLSPLSNGCILPFVGAACALEHILLGTLVNDLRAHDPLAATALLRRAKGRHLASYTGQW